MILRCQCCNQLVARFLPSKKSTKIAIP